MEKAVRSTTLPTKARWSASRPAHPEAGGVRGFLRTGGGTVGRVRVRRTARTASSGRASAWSTVDVDVRIGERRIRCKARGVEDESAGYHPPHTVWSWSAGVGTLDGRPRGRLEPRRGGERPARALRACDLGRRRTVRARAHPPSAVSRRSASRTARESSARPRPSARAPRSAARSPTPTASLSARSRERFPGGLRLESAMGVMESHDAHW